ncbi:hypothetical protein SLAV_05585 [Streptomyces lavendulae subsp. lavendulae]|uniref:Uncharacterized protein n=1 Tax=Streptomyces lavendulae subsp. lavendulae TaxID=58340 RepID=A0A2K8P8F0_STRLA|nr:hypothetical protein SLAV_05585 [Streptomyces lavendulae subsp. lavendulae]
MAGTARPTDITAVAANKPGIRAARGRDADMFFLRQQSAGVRERPHACRSVVRPPRADGLKGTARCGWCGVSAAGLPGRADFHEREVAALFVGALADRRPGVLVHVERRLLSTRRHVDPCRGPRRQHGALSCVPSILSRSSVRPMAETAVNTNVKGAFRREGPPGSASAPPWKAPYFEPIARSRMSSTRLSEANSSRSSMEAPGVFQAVEFRTESAKGEVALDGRTEGAPLSLGVSGRSDLPDLVDVL